MLKSCINTCVAGPVARGTFLSPSSSGDGARGISSTTCSPRVVNALQDAGDYESISTGGRFSRGSEEAGAREVTRGDPGERKTGSTMVDIPPSGLGPVRNSMTPRAGMVSTSSSKSHGDLPLPSEVQHAGRDSFGANTGRSWFSKSLKSFSRLKTALKKRTVSGTRGAHNAGSPRGPTADDAGSPRGPCPVSSSTTTPKAASAAAAASPTARDAPLQPDPSRGSPRLRASPVTWAPSVAIPASALDDHAVTADRPSRPEGQPHPTPPSPTSAAPASPSRAPSAQWGSRCSPSRLSPSSLRPSSPTHPSPTHATPAPQLPYLPHSSAALADRDAERCQPDGVRTSPIYGQYPLYGCPTDALMHLASIQEETALQASPPDSGRDAANAGHTDATGCAAAAGAAPASLAAAAASTAAAPPALKKANSGEVVLPGDLAAARLSLPGGSMGMGVVSGFGFNVSARRLLGRQPAVSSPLGARSSSGNGSAAAAAPEAPHQRAVRIARGVHSPHTSSRALLTRQRTPFALRRTPPNLPSSASALRLQDTISPPMVPRSTAAAGSTLHTAHSGTLPPGLQLCTGSVEGFMSERDSVPGTGRPACPESADGLVDPWQWTRQALRGSSSGAVTLGDDGLPLTLPPPVRTYGGGTSPAVSYRHRAAQRPGGGSQARFVGGLNSPSTRAPAILARQQTPCPLRHGGWLDSWDVASGNSAFVVLGGEPDRERDREVYDGIARQSLDGVYGRPRLGTQDGGATTDAGSEASGTLGVMPAQVRAWGRGEDAMARCTLHLEPCCRGARTTRPTVAHANQLVLFMRTRGACQLTGAIHAYPSITRPCCCLPILAVMGLRSGRSRAMSRQSSLQRALHVQLQVGARVVSVWGGQGRGGEACLSRHVHSKQTPLLGALGCLPCKEAAARMTTASSGSWAGVALPLSPCLHACRTGSQGRLPWRSLPALTCLPTCPTAALGYLLSRHPIVAVLPRPGAGDQVPAPLAGVLGTGLRHGGGHRLATARQPRQHAHAPRPPAQHHPAQRAGRVGAAAAGQVGGFRTLPCVHSTSQPAAFAQTGLRLRDLRSQLCEMFVKRTMATMSLTPVSRLAPTAPPR